MILLAIWGAGFVGYLVGWSFRGGCSVQQLQDAAMQGYLAGHQARINQEATQPQFRSIEEIEIEKLIQETKGTP